MCQLGWATAPRYLLKHYSGCFCEGVFWMSFRNIYTGRLWVKQVACHDIGGLCLISWRTYENKADLPLRKKELYLKTAFGLKLLLFPGPPACWPARRIWGSPWPCNYMSQFLKIISLPICMFLCVYCAYTRIHTTHTHTCINPIGAVFLENSNQYITCLI